MHCVTRWSKLGTVWRGVPVSTLLSQAGHDAPYVLAFCDGGYTTNLPIEDVTGGRAWVAFSYDGQPLGSEHGGPARLLVPHLYFWKSAKWVGAWNCSITTNPVSGKPTATTDTEIHGGNSGTRATELGPPAVAGRPGELGAEGMRRPRRLDRAGCRIKTERSCIAENLRIRREISA
ncbi:MAG TPA: molybdopterin-dependent oxidoreductase [Streptosporangiaceae bacterium]